MQQWCYPCDRYGYFAKVIRQPTTEQIIFGTTKFQHRSFVTSTRVALLFVLDRRMMWRLTTFFSSLPQLMKSSHICFDRFRSFIRSDRHFYRRFPSISCAVFKYKPRIAKHIRILPAGEKYGIRDSSNHRWAVWKGPRNIKIQAGHPKSCRWNLTGKRNNPRWRAFCAGSGCVEEDRFNER